MKGERSRREDYEELEWLIYKTENSLGDGHLRVARRHQGRRAYRDFGKSAFEEK